MTVLLALKSIMAAGYANILDGYLSESYHIVGIWMYVRNSASTTCTAAYVTLVDTEGNNGTFGLPIVPSVPNVAYITMNMDLYTMPGRPVQVNLDNNCAMCQVQLLYERILQ